MVHPVSGDRRFAEPVFREAVLPKLNVFFLKGIFRENAYTADF